MAARKKTEKPGPAAERRAEKYLVQAGLLRRSGSCPACRTKTRIRTADGFRCRACGAIWDQRTGSLLEGLPLTCKDFIGIIRFYAGGIPAGEAAAHLGMGCAATGQAYARIRAAIAGEETRRSAGHEPEGEGFQQNTGGDTEAVTTAIFGIRTEKGRITIEQLPPGTPDRFIPLQVPGMLRGNILFINAPKNSSRDLSCSIGAGTGRSCFVSHPMPVPDGLRLPGSGSMPHVNGRTGRGRPGRRLAGSFWISRSGITARGRIWRWQ